jgi:hypothetical protein
VTGKASQPREKLFRRLEKFLSGLKIFSSGWKTLPQTGKTFWRLGNLLGGLESLAGLLESFSDGRKSSSGWTGDKKRGVRSARPPESFLLGTYFVAGGVEGVGAAGVGAVVGVGGSGLVTVLRERLRSGWIPSSTSFSLRFP